MLLGLWSVPLELGSGKNGPCCRKPQTCSALDQVQGNEIQLRLCDWSACEKAETCEDGSLDADRDPQWMLDAGNMGRLEDGK